MSAPTCSLRRMCVAVALLLLFVFACCDGRRSRSKKPELLRVLISRPKSIFYQHGNVTCRKCDPGSYVASHCRENYGQSECKPCPPGTYSSKYSRARKCAHCADCYDAYSEILARCSSTSNTRCICKVGYGVISSDDTGHSKDCIDCAHHGKISVMDRMKVERICVNRCLDSQFYEEETGECRPCTDCEATGYVTSQACSPASDAVCQPPSPTSTTGPPEEEKTDGISGGAIAGIGIGVPLVVVAGVVAMVAGVMYRRRKKNANQHKTVLNTGQNKQEQVKKPEEREMLPVSGTDDAQR